MRKILITLILTFLLKPVLTLAQSESLKYLPDKPGKWRFSNRISRPGTAYVAFGKNLAAVAGWFHRNVPIMTNPKGFDLSVAVYKAGSNNYEKRKCNYGLPCEISFEFQLFFAKGGQWIVEPPFFKFDINNTETGHVPGTTYNVDNREKDLKPEVQINKAAGNLNDLFTITPFVKEIAPGVRLYGDGHLIVFNPNRPEFWIPVTVRQVAEMKLEYLSLKKDTLLPHLKKEIAKLSEEDLNAPAYGGNAELFVLNVNSKKEGLQMMRFNPEYWDRSLPTSAIQFMALWYPQLSESESEEYFKNNGHPHYGQLVIKSIKLEELADLIIQKK